MFEEFNNRRCDASINSLNYIFLAECFTRSKTAVRYEGLLDVSKSGQLCLPWSETELPSAGNHSYCRAPRPQDLQPWCYIQGRESLLEKPCEVEQCKESAHLGCFRLDKPPIEVLNAVPIAENSMTIDRCLQLCRTRLQDYAGLSGGDKCYCIFYAKERLTEAKDCLTPCKGNEEQKCGGDTSIDIYDVNMGRCGGKHYGLEGTIYSPGYPSLYPNGINCTWDINVPGNRIIQLRFKHRNIGYPTDIVDVQDMVISKDRARITQWNQSRRFLSSSSRVRVYFRSDPQSGGGQFTLSYKALTSCPTPTIPNGSLEINRKIKTDRALFKPGEEVNFTFSCDAGYQKCRKKRKSATCKNSGSWSKLPECRPDTLTCDGQAPTVATTKPREPEDPNLYEGPKQRVDHNMIIIASAVGGSVLLAVGVVTCIVISKRRVSLRRARARKRARLTTAPRGQNRDNEVVDDVLTYNFRTLANTAQIRLQIISTVDGAGSDPNDQSPDAGYATASMTKKKMLLDPPGEAVYQNAVMFNTSERASTKKDPSSKAPAIYTKVKKKKRQVDSPGSTLGSQTSRSERDFDTCEAKVRPEPCPRTSALYAKVNKKRPPEPLPWELEELREPDPEVTYPELDHVQCHVAEVTEFLPDVTPSHSEGVYAEIRDIMVQDSRGSSSDESYNTYDKAAHGYSSE
ncbi:KREMEN1 [Branchiostoma lanceolatum]|uniref:Kringle-containing protein marking the eye and the nose n=1 Tax=Branchiostoma lanceolatum TaxID=7740 RepID=A0A8K0ENG2_BRALA|nr:KREMEN1 [Branchiostoma lanceolatum]